jgi:50S ribosomal protein L16 3-hydroxylase
MFAPLSRSAFLRDYYLSRPFVAKGPLARFSNLAAVGSLALELDRLLAGKVKIDAQIRMPNGQFVALPIEAHNALFAYSAGIQLYIHLDPREPGPLQALSALLHEELGIPAQWGEIGVYAAKKGGLGVDWHFDRNENLMLQLGGRKVWKLARNDSFQHPMVNQLLNGSINPLNALARTSAPVMIPPEVETVSFEPGTAAYIPRGHWHETESGDEGSLSVAITWSLRTWGESVVRKLLNQLLTDPNFRRVAPMGLIDDPVGDASSREYIETHVVPAIRAFADRIASHPELLIPRRDDAS